MSICKKIAKTKIGKKALGFGLSAVLMATSVFYTQKETYADALKQNELLAEQTEEKPGNSLNSFFDNAKVHFYLDTSVSDDKVTKQNITRFTSEGFNLGVEYDDKTNNDRVKAIGSSINLNKFSIGTTIESLEDRTNYEIKLQKKITQGLSATIGGGKVDENDMFVCGFNYKNLGNKHINWGCDAGVIKLDKTYVAGDAWVNFKKLIKERDIFFGTNYDEREKLSFVASLPSDNGWALRYFHTEDLTRGDKSRFNQLIFTTKARPTYMDESDSYYLTDLDITKITAVHTYLDSPLKYIVPKIQHMGQGSKDKLEFVGTFQEMKTKKGDRILKGEADIYFNKNIWAGISGQYKQKTHETVIGVPFGLYHQFNNGLSADVRVEPSFNMETNNLGGNATFNIGYKF